MTAPVDLASIETAELSDIGRQRVSNQDACASAVSHAGARLLIVADGMGGHAGGATASRMAVQTVMEHVEHSSEAPEVLLRSAFEEANRCVFAESLRDTEVAGMGTTGVALLFTPEGGAWVANVGDSRAYRLRDGALEQLTRDHSLVAELQRRGMLTAEEARFHPRRNEVLRSIGVDAEVEVDLDHIEVRAGDHYLLCSDGLSGVATDDEIAAILARESPGRAVRALVDAANERGGPDNITVQIARLPGASDAPHRTHAPHRRLTLWLAAALAVTGLSLIVFW